MPEPFEPVFQDVVKKFLPELQALNALLDSEEGFPVTPYRPLKPAQHQSILYGPFFRGLDQPLAKVKNDVLL